MFCQRCGRENDEDAKFCFYCGEEIVDSQPAEVSVGQFLRNRIEIFICKDIKKGSITAKEFLLRHRKVSIVCAVVLVLFIGAISAVGTAFGPEQSAKKFFENYMNKDWATVYQEIYLPESQMLDKDRFLQVAEQWDVPEYVDYQVEPLVQPEEASLYRSYWFTYSTAGSIETSQMEVTLVRAGKKALFFDDYKVLIDGLVAEDCTVMIPEGATLLLDGETLETEMTVDGGYQICQLPQMFTGTYTIGFRHPVYECESITEHVSSNAFFDLTENCTVDASTLQDSTYGDVTKYFSNIFAAALNGNTLEESNVPICNGWETTATDDFSDFQENCASTVADYGTFQLTNLELEDVYLDIENGTVYCDFSYECQWQNPKFEYMRSQFSNSANMTVAFQDGTWQLLTFQVYGIY